MPHVTSKDGSVIGYDQLGDGPPVIFVNGSLAYRDYYGDRELAGLLADEYTVVIYDRRGRGESTDTEPYAIEREIEDIEALIDAVGGSAALYGVSAGAVLALNAAARLGRKVTRLVIYEPPYGTGDSESAEHSGAIRELARVLDDGNRTAAIALFMGNFMAPDEIEEFRKANADEWSTMERVAPTLAYDYAIMSEQAPPAVASVVTIPTLVVNGSEGIPLDEALTLLAAALPNARREILEGQGHTPDAEALAPTLRAFYKG